MIVHGAERTEAGVWGLPDQDAAVAALHAEAEARALPVVREVAGIPRVWLRTSSKAERASAGLFAEECLVVAPAVVAPKVLPVFVNRWRRLQDAATVGARRGEVAASVAGRELPRGRVRVQ